MLHICLGGRAREVSQLLLLQDVHGAAADLADGVQADLVVMILIIVIIITINNINVNNMAITIISMFLSITILSSLLY